MKNLVFTCLLLASLPICAQGQEKPRTCRVIFPERPKDAPTEAYIFDGKTSQKVFLPSLNFSQVIELPQGKITIGMTPDPISDPETFPEGAPTVSFTASQTDLYLLIYSDPKNKVLPIRIQPISIDSSKLIAGETMWLNFSKRKIAAKLGKEEFFIEPKKRAVNKAPLNKSGYYLAQFFYKGSDDPQYLPIMKKSWWHDEYSKNLGFVIDIGARMPKIYTFRDRRWAKPKPQP